MADQPATQRAQDWRSGQAGTSKTKKGASRGTKIFAVLGTMMVLIGAVAAVAWLIWPHPQPYFVALSITDYGKDPDHFPILNPLARVDSDELRQLSWESSNTVGSQYRQLLVNELKDLERQKKDRPVIVYLCACALVEDGEVYVLPADAKPGDSSTWLAFGEVLRYIRSCPSVHKLLIVDLMRPVADPRLGVLADDVARHIPKALEAVPDENRLVLTACSPGQFSCTSEELGRSVFGYYLDQGLKGKADRYNPSGKDNQAIRVSELAEFVTARVDRWVDHNRRTRQTPVLYGMDPEGKKDFDMLGIDAKPRPLKSDPLPETSPVPWETRDRWWNDEGFQLVPQAYLQLEAHLVRAENRYRAGIDATELTRELNAEVNPLTQYLGSARKAIPRPDPRRSLAHEAALGWTPPKEEDVKEVLELLKLSQLEKPDKDKLKEESDKFKAKYKDKPIDLAWVVFQAAADDTFPSQARVNFYHELIARLPSKNSYVETLALRRLSGLVAEKWPTDTVRLFLQVVRLGEQAEAGDPRALPWIRPLLNAAAQKRHEAEIIFFSPGFVAATDADTLFEDAAREYGALAEQIEKIHKAYRVRDEATVVLPSHAYYLMQRSEVHEREESDWVEAVRATRDLQSFLAAEPASGPQSDADIRNSLAEIVRRAEAVQRPLASLQREFQFAALKDVCKSATEQEQGRADDYVHLNELLQISWLGAKERSLVAAAARTIGNRLNTAIMVKDKADDDAATKTGKPVSSWDENSAVREEQKRAERRARLSIHLLRLAGLTSTDKVTEAEAKATRPGAEDKAWDTLAKELRLAWSRQVPEQLRQIDPKNLEAADQLSRQYHARAIVRLTTDPDKNSSVQLHQAATKAFWARLGTYYLYESKEQPPGTSADFFAAAAQDYLLPRLAGIEVDQAARDLDRPRFVSATGKDAVQLGRDKRTDTLPLQIEFETEHPTAPALKTLPQETEWLKIEAASLDGQSGKVFKNTLRVQLQPFAESSNSNPPAGFLVKVQPNGQWAFLHRVRVEAPQPDRDRAKIALSSTSDKLTELAGRIRVRPNTTQRVYLFVQNPTGKAKKLAVVVKAPGLKEVRKEISLLATDKSKLVNLDGADPKPDTPLPELRDALQIQVFDLEKNPTVPEDEKQIQVGVMHPREYVQITEMYYQPPTADKPGENHLVVTLKPLQAITGPDCRIEMVVPPERNPGLIGLSKKDDTLSGILSAKAESLRLIAKNIQMKPGGDETGVFYLTVDGYQRAFIVPTTFKRDGTTRLNLQPSYVADLRLKVDRAIAVDSSKPSFSLPFQLEADNAPEDAVLRVDMERIKDAGFAQPPLEFTGGKQKYIGFTVAGDGSLFFDTKVSDWANTLDATQIFGERQLRARLFMKDTDRKEYLVKTDTRKTILDSTGPVNVKFSRPPAPSQNNPGNYVLVAQGEDPESDISEVWFFVGEPMNNMVDPKVRKFKGNYDEQNNVWTAEIPVPAGNMGPVPLSVQVLNGVKQGDFATVMVTVVAAGPKPARIEGTVMEGERLQPGLTVQLVNEKGEEILKTKTGDKDNTRGAYAFEDVPPGKYKVRVEKEASSKKLKDEKEVVIKAGEKKEINLTVK